MSDLNRPIIGIENRTPQEVFDIMCDRITPSRRTGGWPSPEQLARAWPIFKEPAITQPNGGQNDH